MKLCLAIMQSLDYGADKVHVVLNRANSTGGLSVQEIEHSLNLEFYATVPSDGKTVMTSINKGIPFVISHQQTPVAKSVFQLAEKLIPDEPHQAIDSKSLRRISIFG